MSIIRMVAATLLTTSLALGASACGGSDGDGDGAGDGVDSTSKPAGTAPGDGTFTSQDEVTVAALKAVGATTVDIGPSEVRVHFKGSADDATAWTYCTAIKALIGPKAAIIVYADGELACADRNGD